MPTVTLACTPLNATAENSVYSVKKTTKHNCQFAIHLKVVSLSSQLSEHSSAGATNKQAVKEF